jgi:hypothetical protein
VRLIHDAEPFVVEHAALVAQTGREGRGARLGGVVPLLVVGAWVGLLATPAGAATPALRGVGIDETLAGRALLAEALNQAAMRAQGLPLYARILVAPGELQPPDETGHGFEKLDERVERYTLKGVAVILALAGPLPAPEASEGWRHLLRSLAERYRGRINAYQIGDVSGQPPPDVHDYAFALKTAAVEVRAADPNALIVQGSLRAEDLAWQAALYAEGVAPYLDAVAVSGREDELVGALPAFEKLLAQEDATASLVITGFSLNEDPPKAVRGLLDWQLSRLGSKALLTTYAGTQGAVAAALPSVERLKDLLTSDLVLLEDKSAGIKLGAGGEAAGGAPSHSLLASLDDFGMYLVLWGREPNPGALDIELVDPSGRKPTLRGTLNGRNEDLPGAIWDPNAHLTRVSVAPSDHPLILAFTYSETAYLAHTEVSAEMLPVVGEIVFRHQLAQAAQDAILQTYVANAQVESTFHLSDTTTFDVVTENRFYSDKEGSEWEETAFSLNGTRWKEKRPAVLAPQAEKVLSLALDLRLNQDYRYHLEGIEIVGGQRCYAVRFEPVSESQSFYRGTVWIDTKTFARLKLQAVQTHLGSPVVSSEEIQDFTPVTTAGERPLDLLSHFTSRQIMLIGGRSLLVERNVRFSDFEVNSPSFSERRAAARAGDKIMFRDTEHGLRNFVKRGDHRVVEESPSTTFKALAVGVIVDPSFNFPLPLLGFNYLDFHFLSKDTQVAVLFGGILAVGNIQRPRVLGDHVDASLDFFAIAVRGNNEVFDGGREVRSERLRTRPFSTGLSLGWQVTPFQKLTASYKFRFEAYSRDDGTAPDFVTPVDTVTNGVGLGYTYRRGGYAFVAEGFHYQRASWRSWGDGKGFSPEQRSYRKFSVSLSKDFSIQTFQKIHVNVAYFGGQRLDRFSMYAFNHFDQNGIHGVPSSGVRFSDLGMVRAGYSFNVFNLYGLDLFLDQAAGRQRVFDAKWRSITGTGLGLNVKAPFGTLLRGEISKSFLPARYRGSGSIVAQVVVLKPL